MWASVAEKLQSDWAATIVPAEKIQVNAYVKNLPCSFQNSGHAQLVTTYMCIFADWYVPAYTHVIPYNSSKHAHNHLLFVVEMKWT